MVERLRLSNRASGPSVQAVWTALAVLVVGALLVMLRRQRHPPDEGVEAVGKLAEVRSQSRHADLKLIKKLAELKDQGIITQAEFEEKKAALLKRIK